MTYNVREGRALRRDHCEIRLYTGQCGCIAEKTEEQHKVWKYLYFHTSHTKRLSELNFRTLMDEIPVVMVNKVLRSMVKVCYVVRKYCILNKGIGCFVIKIGRISEAPVCTKHIQALLEVFRFYDQS